MPLFIRVENENGEGIYHSSDIACDLSIQKPNQPEPCFESTELLNAFLDYNESCFFGFKDFESLTNWFTSQYIDLLIEGGEEGEFFVSFYEVESRIDGRRQSIIIKPQKMELKKQIPFFELYLSVDALPFL